MTLLAIDCAASLCAACVYDQARDTELGREVRDIGKGHAEQLMDVIAKALAAGGKAYADLDRIAVSVGPGSFTGVRVGVSTARGLALALKIPAVGVTTLEAIAAEAVRMAENATSITDDAGHRTSDSGRVASDSVLAAIDAGRDGIYVAVYDRFGSVQYDPVIMTLEEAAGLASRERLALAGSAAGRIAALMGEAEVTGFEGATADIAIYAQIAAGRGTPVERPKPLYLRAPDAKPQAGFVLPRRTP